MCASVQVNIQCLRIVFLRACVCERVRATMPGNTLRMRHCLTFATGLVECLCFAGAVFGWASLVFVLKTEGYFSSLCVNTTGVNATQVLGQFDILTPTTSERLDALMLQNIVFFSSTFLKSTHSI